MAFDDKTRNRLSSFVGTVRSLLSEEFAYQLRNVYGLDPTSGEISEISSLPTLSDADQQTALILRELFAHYLAGVPTQTKDTPAEILNRIVREQAFTVLNRLCAVRMAEARDLLIESIAKGYQSKGFQLYARLAGHALGETGDAYKTFLFSVFDECALDLPVLFDPFDQHGRLFPRESVLLKVLDEINHHELAHLWAEDETIGWIYQYFNSKEERKAMRDASQAPRNSRELAVRNQFFTPRYVVEFLTDNTLGRIWYEMRKGQTRLVDECQYLVRRPNEVFLAAGEEPPADAEEVDNADLTQEELLNQPVHIPHRPLKDPREIRMLDPACGSMHFGLYAFDLYLKIYEEFWDLVASDDSVEYGSTDLPPLDETYESREAFLRDVPRLIIEHNIHGIDIDPRAVQIAGLSLWLRAQRAWKSHGLAAADRPQVNRSHIVCAEPMPGDKDQLAAFCNTLQPAIAQMVTAIFDEMKLAGEAGSLLKIEEEISSLVAKAKEQWQKQPKEKQRELFGGDEAPKQQQLEFDLSGINDQQFFDQAEETIYEELRKYASETSEGGFRRKLFAGDAEKGFAFIELCRKTFEVALMNPPFGEAAKASNSHQTKKYPNSKQDIFQCFVERSIRALNDAGMIGVLSARTGFFMGESESWRTEVVWKNQLRLFADLGLGVLDDALVEAAAYTLRKGESTNNTIFASRHLSTQQKETSLVSSIANPEANFAVPQQIIDLIPHSVFGYWAPLTHLKRFESFESFEEGVAKVRQGLATADDFRFARLGWEVPNENIGRDHTWSRFSKGGAYSPPYDDIHLLVKWSNDGDELRSLKSARVQNDGFYHSKGATYTVRTASAFAAKILPADCIFSHNAQSWFPSDQTTLEGSIFYCMSRVPQSYVELAVGGGDVATSGSAARRYTTKVVHSIPAAQVKRIGGDKFRDDRHSVLDFTEWNNSVDETTCLFVGFDLSDVKSIDDLSRQVHNTWLSKASGALEATYRIDNAVTESFEITDAELDFVNDEIGLHPCSYPNLKETNIDDFFQMSIDELMEKGKEELGASRWITKKSYFVDRKIELICHANRCHPEALVEKWNGRFYKDLSEDIISHSVGIAFRRFSAALYGKSCSGFADNPFVALPQCSPAMGPLDDAIPILVEDSTKLEDFGSNVQSAFEEMFPHSYNDILAELHSNLGVTLGEWLAKRFFEFHLSRYSKSRRSAPIYWPISTESGSYTLWFYYHRLTDQTLYKAVNDFVDPKLKQTLRQLADLRAINDRSSSQEKELAQLTELESELEQFKADLLEIAAFWKPNLNDGVQITAAPLWKFFRHRAWSNKLKKTWEDLQTGKYDWAHLALSIWPDRVVREKCTTDRSIAIAHDLEEELWEEVEVTKTTRGGRETTKLEWQPKDLSTAELDAIVAQVKGGQGAHA